MKVERSNFILVPNSALSTNVFLQSKCNMHGRYDLHGIKPLRLNGSFDSKCTRPETSHSYQSFTILINTSTGIIVDLDNLCFKWHNNSRHQTVK